MKKLFFTLTLLLAVISSASAQLLYRISGKGLEKPSYIVGTYHLAPATFVDSIPGARAALDEVEQVCGEVDNAEMESMAGRSRLMKAMMLPDGKSLADVLSTDEMDRLNAYMKELLGADLTNPLIKSQMGKMNPMAISTQLQLVQYMKVTPGFNPTALIDGYFQQQAKKAHKPVMGFETIDFQMSVLYGTAIERQKELLFCMIDNQEYTEMSMKELTEAYFSQDMEKIIKNWLNLQVEKGDIIPMFVERISVTGTEEHKCVQRKDTAKAPNKSAEQILGTNVLSNKLKAMECIK